MSASSTLYNGTAGAQLHSRPSGDNSTHDDVESRATHTCKLSDGKSCLSDLAHGCESKDEVSGALASFAAGSSGATATATLGDGDARLEVVR